MSDHDLVPSEVEPVVRERRRILPFFNFLLILALGGGAVIFWYWFLEPQLVSKQDVADVQADTRELGNQVESLSNRQVNLPQDLLDGVSQDLTTLIDSNADSLREQQQQIDELEALFDVLAASLENALSKSSNPEQDAIKKSQNDHLTFLLRLARNQLNLWNDPISALRSLEEVDSVLAESNNVVFDSTRAEVLIHIQRLKELASTDTTGVLLRLNILADGVVGIPFNDARLLTETERTRTESELPSEEGAEERSIWRSLMDGAMGLVKVKSHEQLEIQPLLSPEEQRLVRLRLSLNLEKASQAVLKSNQLLYDSSLDTVIGIVNRQFKTEDAAVATFLEEIVELRAIRVEMDFPDLDQTIQNFQIVSESNPQIPEPKLEMEKVELSIKGSSN